MLVAGGSLGPIVYSRLGWAAEPDASGVVALLILATFTGLALAAWSLTQRARRPLLCLGLPTATGLLLPIGPLTAVLALALVLARWRGPAIRWASLAAAAGSTVMVLSDALANPVGASWVKYLVHGEHLAPSASAPSPWWQVLVIHAIVLLLATAAGLLQRGAWERSALASVAEDAASHSAALSQEVARRSERERIAREVHDALGHRLSVISLHAGALSTLVEPGTPAAISAEHVQQAAAAAVDDLHNLLRILRQEVDASWPGIPLHRLEEVIEEAARADQAVSSSVFLQDAEDASATLSRAVFRIVQELLTNARKHAPGLPVRLRVSGGAAEGIIIEARNALPAGAPGTGTSGPGARAGRTGHDGPARQGAHGDRGAHSGSGGSGGYGGSGAGEGGHGLEGISERVAVLGGTMEHGPDPTSGQFTVRIHLPWLPGSEHHSRPGQ